MQLQKVVKSLSKAVALYLMLGLRDSTQIVRKER